jgi:hypothetical protein
VHDSAAGTGGDATASEHEQIQSTGTKARHRAQTETETQAQAQAHADRGTEQGTERWTDTAIDRDTAMGLSLSSAVRRYGRFDIVVDTVTNDARQGMDWPILVTKKGRGEGRGEGLCCWCWC